MTTKKTKTPSGKEKTEMMNGDFNRHNLNIILKDYTSEKLIDFFKIRFESKQNA